MIHKFGWPISVFSIVFVLTVGTLLNTSYGQQPYPQNQYQRSQPAAQPQPARTPSDYVQPNQTQHRPTQRNYNQNPPNRNQPRYQQPANPHRPGYTPRPTSRQPVARPMGPVARPPHNTRPVAPRAPFQLTPEQQAYVDRVLVAWEKYGDRIDTFQTDFTLRVYGSVFQNGEKPEPQMGKLKYKKPDKGFFEVAGSQPEKWICDGNSLFKFEYAIKELKQYPLPPEERGKGIQNGPLPFLFGAKAASLKQRYWIRALPSPENGRDQIWLQAFPKHARDAAEFLRAEMIISAKDLHPIGIRLHKPNGKETYSYVFKDIIVNDRNPLKFFKGDPFKPKVPSGWRKVVDNIASTQPNALRPRQR